MLTLLGKVLILGGEALTKSGLSEDKMVNAGCSVQGPDLNISADFGRFCMKSLLPLYFIPYLKMGTTALPYFKWGLWD